MKLFIWCGQSTRLGFFPESFAASISTEMIFAQFLPYGVGISKCEADKSEPNTSTSCHIPVDRCSNYRTVNASGFRIGGIVACEMVMHFCGCARPAHAACRLFAMHKYLLSKKFYFICYNKRTGCAAAAAAARSVSNS